MIKDAREKRTAVTPVMVEALCECGGTMKATGEVLMTYPARYVHACKACGTAEEYGNRYPEIRYDTVGPAT